MVQGAKRLRGVAGIQGPLGVQGPVGTTGVQGERGPEGHYGTQDLVGEIGDRGERGTKREKGIEGDTSDVLADHLPIQLASRYGEKNVRNVSAYHEPAWHFDGKFVNGPGHVRANNHRGICFLKNEKTENIW